MSRSSRLPSTENDDSDNHTDTPAHPQTELNFLRSSLGITSNFGSNMSRKLKKHSSASGGHVHRAGRASSSTTNMQYDDHRSHPSTGYRAFGDNRTEFGSFKSADVTLRHRSTRLDSEASKISSNFREHTKLTQKAPKKGPRISDFLIGQKIGEGSYARVHLCKAKDTPEKICALKILEIKFILKEKKAALIKNELAVFKDCAQCTNLVSLSCSFKDSTYLYFVIEFCKGGDLSRVISHHLELKLEQEVENRAMDIELVQFYVAETILGLQFLHNRGWIHRDIKPENLLLTEDGHLKIADFGTAKIEGGQKPSKKEFVGSPNYVSPEVLDDDSIERDSVGCDIWAVGVLIFHLLVGKPCFKCETTFLTMEKISEHNDSSFVSLPERTESGQTVSLTPDEHIVQDLINKLLHKVPSKRLGAANNCSARHPDFDRSVNQPRLLRNHPFFTEVDFSTIGFSTPPATPVPISLTDKWHDGGDPNWMFQGEATDLDLPKTFVNRKVEQRADSQDKVVRTVNLGRPSLSSAEIIRSPTQMRRKKMKTRSQKLSNIFNRATPSLANMKSKVKKTVRLDDVSFSMKRKENKILSVDEGDFVHYLDDDEKVLMFNMIKKRNGLFLKDRVLMLTDKPRFLYFHPVSHEKKGEIFLASTVYPVDFIKQSEHEFHIVQEKFIYRFSGKNISASEWQRSFNAVN